MSSRTTFYCDWCGEEQGDNRNGMRYVKIPSHAVPESLEHVDSGMLRDFDTCGDCVDALRGLFEAFAANQAAARMIAAPESPGATEPTG